MLVDEVSESLNLGEFRHRQDAVAQIEDVAGSPFCAVENVTRCLKHSVLRPEENGRIQIPLHRSVFSNFCPPVVERHPPIESDHVSTGLPHFGQQRGRARTEMQCGNAEMLDRGENLQRVR